MREWIIEEVDGKSKRDELAQSDDQRHCERRAFGGENVHAANARVPKRFRIACLYTNKCLLRDIAEQQKHPHLGQIGQSRHDFHLRRVAEA